MLGRTLGGVKKQGRSHAYRNGSLAPIVGRRSLLATMPKHVLPGQTQASIPPKVATKGGELRPSRVQKQKTPPQNGGNTMNTAQSSFNQPRFSGDMLAQFRKLARGGVPKY